jgi:hypothetical protein
MPLGSSDNNGWCSSKMTALFLPFVFLMVVITFSWYFHFSSFKMETCLKMYNRRTREFSCLNAGKILFVWYVSLPVLYIYEICIYHIYNTYIIYNNILVIVYIVKNNINKPVAL